MNRPKLSPEDLRGVFAVPPLARRPFGGRILDDEQNYFIRWRTYLGGIKRYIYGGNAFVYHQTLRDWTNTIEWLESFPEEAIVVPSIGPAFGIAWEQADLLRRQGFQTAMVLPCGDPRDAAGLESGYRELAYRLSGNLIIYLKDE